jgi:hypothetical protein
MILLAAATGLEAVAAAPAAAHAVPISAAPFAYWLNTLVAAGGVALAS